MLNKIGNVNPEQPELTVDEVTSNDEATVNQNGQNLNQQDEVEKDSNDNQIKDKLIGYYQDLVSSFSNFMSFLK